MKLNSTTTQTQSSGSCSVLRTFIWFHSRRLLWVDVAQIRRVTGFRAQVWRQLLNYGCHIILLVANQGVILLFVPPCGVLRNIRASGSRRHVSTKLTQWEQSASYFARKSTSRILRIFSPENCKQSLTSEVIITLSKIWRKHANRILSGVARVWAALGSPWVWRPRSP